MFNNSMKHEKRYIFCNAKCKGMSNVSGEGKMSRSAAVNEHCRKMMQKQSGYSYFSQRNTAHD